MTRPVVSLALLAVVALGGLSYALLRPKTPPNGLPFIENDWAAAVARARAEGKPIFAESWAPF